jgi:hypothetical protein
MRDRSEQTLEQRQALIALVESEIGCRRLSITEAAIEIAVGRDALQRFLRGDEVMASVVFSIYAWLDEPRAVAETRLDEAIRAMEGAAR